MKLSVVQEVPPFCLVNFMIHYKGGIMMHTYLTKHLVSSVLNGIPYIGMHKQTHLV